MRELKELFVNLGSIIAFALLLYAIVRIIIAKICYPKLTEEQKADLQILNLVPFIQVADDLNVSEEFALRYTKYGEFDSYPQLDVNVHIAKRSNDVYIKESDIEVLEKRLLNFWKYDLTPKYEPYVIINP